MTEEYVSRKAVIAETYRDCTDVKSDEDAYKVLQRIRDGINALPSVQPESSLEHEETIYCETIEKISQALKDVLAIIEADKEDINK